MSQNDKTHKPEQSPLHDASEAKPEWTRLPRQTVLTAQVQSLLRQARSRRLPAA